MARKPYRWVAAWSGLVLLAAVIALIRDYELAAGICAGLAVIDALVASFLLARTVAWAGMERPGLRRIVLSWGALTLLHWAVVIAFPGVISVEAILLAGAGGPPAVIAFAAFTSVRYMSLVADALRPDEQPVAFCSGVTGSPPRSAMLAATEERVVAFVQPCGLLPNLEELDSLARRDIVDVDLERGAAFGRVSLRTADHELEITNAPLAMADKFVRQVARA